MFAPPPKIIRITLKSMNSEKLVEFYDDLGMLFNNEFKQGKYTYSYNDLTFEICNVNNENETTKNITLRFLIDEIDGYLDGMKKMGIKIIKDSWATKTHQHIQLNDPDGNLIELMTKK